MTAEQLRRCRAAREIASDLVKLMRKVSRLIDVGPVVLADLRADPAGVDELIEVLLPKILVEAQRRSGEHSNGPALVSMAVELIDLEEEWLRRGQRDAERRRDEFAHSLQRLRSLRTAHDIADHLCEEACRACDSDLALFAWTGEELWSPFRHHHSGTRRVQPLRSADEPLHDLPTEQAASASRRTVRVGRGDDRPRPAAVRQLMGRSSYAIAPVLAGDSVIGLLYAAEPAPSSWHDQDVTGRLDRFATQVGGYFDIAMQLRILDAQSAHLRQGISSLERAVAASDTSVDLVQLVGREQAGPAATGTDSRTAPPMRLDSEFTARERDVMGLLAIGLDNKEIGDQLALAESTVKSHVQHMLRKAGAVNRSELIGQFYAASPPIGS